MNHCTKIHHNSIQNVVEAFGRWPLLFCSRHSELTNTPTVNPIEIVGGHLNYKDDDGAAAFKTL